MDWEYAQWIIDILIGLIAFLGGWILKTVRDNQLQNTKDIRDIHMDHLPKKLDREDFQRFTGTLEKNFDSLIKEVRKGNETLSKIDKDLTEKVNGVDRRVAVIESEFRRRWSDYDRQA